MINTLSILGLVVGITLLYSAATLLIGMLVTIDEQDAGLMFTVAWIVGIAAFVIVSMAALDAKGFIDIDGSSANAVITEEAKDD